MNRLRILMDGNTISETPDGWEDITSSIKRVKELNSIFITTDADLTFRHDGYDYLIAKYNDGFCNSVNVELQEYCGAVYETFFKGIIFISSSEVDRKQCTIKVKIEDNSFYAKINNNKSLEVFPFAEQSKNGNAISACPISQIDFFDPNDGVYFGVLAGSAYNCASYRVYDLFSYLIAFITDSEVVFDSTLFGVGGEYEGLTVTCGVVLRNAKTGTTDDSFKDNFQKISFTSLLSEVSKKTDVGIKINQDSFPPTLFIERTTDLREGSVSFSALNIDELTEKIDQEILYSSIRLGSDITSNKRFVLPETGLLFPESISYFGFKNEQFIILGNCNIDKELDLVSQYIISANVIEDILIHGETQYDDVLVFIMCYPNLKATQDTLYLDGSGIPPLFYNLELTNKSSTENRLGGMPNSIAQFLGNGDDTFLATLTNGGQTLPSSVISTSPHTIGIGHLRYDDDYTLPNFDNNNRYGNGTAQGNPVSTLNSRYDVSAGGLYGFNISTKLYVNKIIPTFRFYPTTTVYYPHNTFVEFRDNTGTNILGTARVFIIDSADFYRWYIFDQTGVNPGSSGAQQVWVGGAMVAEVDGSISLPESFTPTASTVDIRLARHDSFSVLVDTYSHSHYLHNYNNSIFDSYQINSDSGDYFYMYLVVNQSPFTYINYAIVDNGGTFACGLTFNGGGTYQTFDPNNYPVYKHAWEYPLTKDEFNTIATNQTQQLEFARSGEHHYNGWIDSVKFKRFKEEKAQFITYTSKNNLH